MKGGASNGQPAARISILARLAGLTSCHRSRKSPTVQSYCWSIAGSHSFLRRAKELVSIPHKISPSRPIFRLEDLEDTMGGGGKVFNRDLKFANRIESRYWTVLRAGGGAVSSGERPVRFTWWGIMERRKSGFFSHPPMEIEKRYLLHLFSYRGSWKRWTRSRRRKRRKRKKQGSYHHPAGIIADWSGRKDRPMVIYKANDEFIRPRAVDSDGIH